MCEIVGLTSLRGIAALYVSLYHYIARYYQGGTTDPEMPLFVRHGYLAVDLFFVLSGFILLYVNQNRFLEKSCFQNDIIQFFKSRAARIFPLYIVVLFILLTKAMITSDGSGRVYAIPVVISNFMLLQVPLNHASIVGVSWSLSVEIVAYLLFPALLFLIRRIHPQQALLLCFISTISALFLVMIYSSAANIDVVAGRWLPLLRGISEFALGMAACNGFLKCSAVTDILGRDECLAVIVASAVILLAVPQSDIIVVALMPFLIMAIGANKEKGQSVLSANPLHWLGNISYSMYLLHVPLFNALDAARPFVHDALEGPLTFAVLLAASTATYRVIERPLRAYFLQYRGRELHADKDDCSQPFVADILVCICTYKRPSLERTLQSLQAQTLPKGVSFRILIVDNAEGGPAKAMVERFSRSATVPVTYINHPGGNVANARNVCLSAAKERWLCFLDDDCIAAPDWLGNLIRCSIETGANVTFGPVKPIYTDTAPRWMRRGEFHVVQVRPDLPSYKSAYTTNVMLDMQSIAVAGRQFREDLGNTGGEDTFFFVELAQSMGLINFAPHAIVYECVAENRQSLSYLIHRRLNNGRTIGMLLETRTNRLLAFIQLAGKLLVCLAMTVLFLFSSVKWRSWLLRAALYSGALMYFFQWKGRVLYGHEKP